MTYPANMIESSDILATIEIGSPFTVAEMIQRYISVLHTGYKAPYLTLFLGNAMCVEKIGVRGSKGELLSLDQNSSGGRAIVYERKKLPGEKVKFCADMKCQYYLNGQCLIAMVVQHPGNMQHRILPRSLPFICK